MKTQLFVFLVLGFLPFFINAQTNLNEIEMAEDSMPKTTPALKEESSKFVKFIEYTLSKIEEHSINRNHDLDRDRDLDRSVILYSKARFSGKSFELNNDWSASRHNKSWNNEIASIEVPWGWEVWLYEKKYFRGEVLVISEDWSVRDDPWWRDRISSIRLFRSSDRGEHRHDRRNGHQNSHRHDHHRKSGVTVYEHHHYSGHSMTIYDDWQERHLDDFWEDRISSIHIPAGYKVILYKDRGFKGRCLTLRGPRLVQLDRDFWNDEVSSIKIIHWH